MKTNIKTFVYGQPRSGTSMLMRVLQMGGIEIEYNEVDDKIKEKFRNPYGLFEKTNPTYTKAFKCTSPSKLKEIPREFKMIYITRDVEQQAKSWKRIHPEAEHLERVKRVKKMFKETIDRSYLHLTYEDIHKNPYQECVKIKEYLGEFDVENAVKAVDKTLLVIR